MTPLNIALFFPKRIARIRQHLKQRRARPFPYWTLELVFYLLDLLGVADIYNTMSNVIKYSSRRLSEREIALARAIFGESLPYAYIRVDERAYLGPRQGNFCYVSFYTINSWGKMNDPLLIHELTHVWQYHHLGMVYIPRALAAQRSAEGYDYGGAGALYHAQWNGKRLLDFNYEQQAEIIEDYFRLLAGLRPTWGEAVEADLPVYAHFAAELQVEKNSIPV